MATEEKPDERLAHETRPDNEPSHGWGLDDLARYAQAQHEAIVQGEMFMVPAYHRLGRTL
jgi:hypothetical protein